MAHIVLEFDIECFREPSKIYRFTINNIPDDHVTGLSKGDEIGFDLVESNEFFYVKVSRKVYLVGHQQPIYVICIPHNFSNEQEAKKMLDKFKIQFADDLAID
ncbi:MAG: hypothetical protein M0R50_06945 [Candidatus Cloacimonetes bacterium]|jgi:hypothetical protein|nr:hypothetical protein [Candidatus Cloacimonadota bacterium]